MILFGDNPDGYLTANLPIYWDETSGTVGVRADGYLGRPALTSLSGSGSVTKYATDQPIHSIMSAAVLGGRFLFEQYPPSDIGLLTAVDAGGAPLLSVVMKDDGTLSIWNGGDALVTSTVLDLDTFYRLGFKGTVRVAGGWAEIYLNQTRIARFAGRTSATDIPIWAGFEVGLVEDCAVNHVYMMDDYGHQPDLIPAFMVKHQRPTTDGTFVDFVASGAPTAAEAIDEDDQDADATFAAAEALSDRMTNVVETLPTTGIIYAVQPVMVARTLGVDGPALRHLLSVDGGAFPGFANVMQPLSTDYRVFREIMYQRGDDGLAFDTARFNATQFGAEVI